MTLTGRRTGNPTICGTFIIKIAAERSRYMIVLVRTKRLLPCEYGRRNVVMTCTTVDTAAADLVV